MLKHPLDFNTRKSLCVHLGETTGQAIAALLLALAARIEALERGKVDVMPIVGDSRAAHGNKVTQHAEQNLSH